MRYGMRSGHASGIAQRRKKMERKMGIDIVCQRTVSVWRRRCRGTFRGAQRTLHKESKISQRTLNIHHRISATKSFLVSH
jgi:hypothetical protein